MQFTGKNATKMMAISTRVRQKYIVGMNYTQQNIKNQPKALVAQTSIQVLILNTRQVINTAHQ